MEIDYLTVLYIRLGAKIGDLHAKDSNAFYKQQIVVCESATKIKLSEPHTQHRLLVSSLYKSYAYHACIYYFYF
jgi:hypothetical protein